MKQIWLRATVFALLALAVVFLLSRDLAQSIETDVSSLIPDDQSVETQLFRSMVSEKHGRIVYLVIDSPDDLGSPIDDLLETWNASPLIRSARRLDSALDTSFLQYVGEYRFELLFPVWLAEKRAEFATSGEPADQFSSWLEDVVLEDLEAFFESPAAMELARGEIVDPLLLVVRTLIRFSDQESEESVPGRTLVWVELAESPLLPEVQDRLATLFQSAENELRLLSSEVELEYAGLVQLAAASRGRIHLDIGKLNGLSLALVAGISLLLARPPWRLLYAVPVALSALLGAVCGTLLVFGRIHVVVIVIGSVLIGTSVDYAFHTLFGGTKSQGRSVRTLLLIACGSTVVGFAVLLMADLMLVRQIGAFVGFGLATAFVVSLCLPRSGEASFRASVFERVRPARKLSYGIVGGLGLAAIWAMVSVPSFTWVEDIRNLEAPDPNAVEKDLQLRAAFGGELEGEAFFSLGKDWLSALAAQATFLDRIRADSPKAEIAFAPSDVLPNTGNVAALLESREQVGNWLTAIQQRLQEEGYESEAFDAFFTAGKAFVRDASIEKIETSLNTLVELMGGPVSLLFGKGVEQAWVVSRVNAAEGEVAWDAKLGAGAALRLSSLTHLNESLDRLRSRIGYFGTIAMGAVSVVVVLCLGWRQAWRVIVLPSAALLISLAICNQFFGPLTMFHLIGCLLGAAIALDYSLFSMEALRLGRAIPFSVWLSAATTGASFFVLTLSFIAGVRDLGAIVTLITLTTLLLAIGCAGLVKPVKTQ